MRPPRQLMLPRKQPISELCALVLVPARFRLRQLRMCCVPLRLVWAGQGLCARLCDGQGLRIV